MTIDKPQYVAIAWTRPVNWAGFSDLPRNIDHAAEKSRTIRYQRDLIRRTVEDSGGFLVHEEAIMELSPDRATPQAMEVVEKLRKVYPDATFIAVNFPKANGWRPHKPLNDLFGKDLPHLIDPDPYYSAEFSFDPARHFSEWEERDEAHRQSKAGHREMILGILARHEGLSLAAKAQALNDQGLKTHTGKAWTKDNLAKFLNSPAPNPAPADQG